MLIAHHVIDILCGRVKHPKLMDLPGVTMESRERAATIIANAQKFDFGDLLLEPLDAEKGMWKLPTLTEDESSFWREGLIPLPYVCCWYEFTLNHSRSGLIVWQAGEDDSRWLVERIDYTKEALLFTGVGLALNREKSTAENLIIEIAGNTELYRELERRANSGVFDGLERVVHSNIGSCGMLALYLTMMLYSRTTETKPSEPPPAKLNRKREAAGKMPLEAHRIVRIVPDSWTKAARQEAIGTHRPPRLHWRRSHLRHYDRNTPRSKWSPATFHNGREGWWVAVIPRQLVGRADLGEVSHEYRIET